MDIIEEMRYNPERICSMVKDAIMHYKQRAETLEKLANRTKEEIEILAEQRADKEIDRLQSQLDMSYGSFDFAEEKAAWLKFCAVHRQCRVNSQNKMDMSKLPYVIPYGFGLGSIYTAVCPICGEQKDITYAEGW